MSDTAGDYNLKEHIRLLAKTKVLTAEVAALKAAARALLDSSEIAWTNDDLWQKAKALEELL